jgi:hypothetical protein
MKNRIFAKLITETYELKEGTKTVYVLKNTEKRDITEIEYNNFINSSRFFRSLGGSEYKERECLGGRIWRIISKSPDQEIKIIRYFDFC